jgi:predicted patatin/cPLA2 family phospholipase
MSKSGLIVEGGGMKCAYSAGILDRFLDDGITFDECIGVSAGSGNLASYLANQRERNLHFYTIYQNHPEYLGMKNYLKHGSYFNLQYIYGTITNSNGIDPVDFDALQANPAEYYLTATNAKTGEAEYLSRADMQRDDFRAIMASCAIPVVCKPVELNGKLYFDGGVADSIPVQKAIEDGCDKLVVILENPRSFHRQPQKYKPFYHVILRRFPEVVKKIDDRHLRYHEVIAQIKDLEAKGKAFVFAPSQAGKVKTATKDSEDIHELYDLGIEDYDARRDELKVFLRE